MIEIDSESELRKAWTDNFGNDLESTKMYNAERDYPSHRVDLNYKPIENENPIIWIPRMRRHAMHNARVSECHFDGSQKIFWCHKNPRNCWVCDLVTIQLGLSGLLNRLIQIPEVEKIIKNCYWKMTDDGSMDWEYIPPKQSN